APVAQPGTGWQDGGGSQNWRAEPRRGLFGRLQDWFGERFGRNPPAPPQGQPPPPAPAAGPRGHQQPVHTNQTPLGPPAKTQAPAGPPGSVAHTAHAAPPSRPVLPIREKYRDQTGHDERYTWITGQLCRLQGKRELVWVLCYGTPEVEDRHGGSVLLDP